MLAEKMVTMLNDQVNLEFFSSNLYLQMSSWFYAQGLDGCGNFMREHADEERGHMSRLFNYVNETGAYAVIGQIEAPKSNWVSLKEVFEETLEHEEFITSKINALAKAAFEISDFSTFNFLQWYVSEQHEEEQLFRGVLDKIKILGEDDKALFYIDQELQKLFEAAGTTTEEPTT